MVFLREDFLREKIFKKLEELEELGKIFMKLEKMEKLEELGKLEELEKLGKLEELKKLRNNSLAAYWAELHWGGRGILPALCCITF